MESCVVYLTIHPPKSIYSQNVEVKESLHEKLVTAAALNTYKTEAIRVFPASISLFCKIPCETRRLYFSILWLLATI